MPNQRARSGEASLAADCPGGEGRPVSTRATAGAAVGSAGAASGGVGLRLGTGDADGTGKAASRAGGTSSRVRYIV